MRAPCLSLAVAAAIFAGGASTAVAQPMGPGPRWAGDFSGDRSWGEAPAPREGKVRVTTYVNHAAAPALGRGPIMLGWSRDNLGDVGEENAFRAALTGALSARGYQPSAGAAGARQVFEVLVTHAMLEPPERRRSPFSGGVEVGGSTGRYGGSGLGLALGVDLTKPRRALLATRVDARIRDAATDTVLWEGHATIATREADRRWPNQRLADVLANGLLDRFPSDL